jgi:hypothetical protein
MTDMRDRRLRPLLSLALLAAAMAVMCGLTLDARPAEAQCTGNDPTAPCFAENDDILGGQRSLLPEDDLVVDAWSKPFVNVQAAMHQVTLETAQLSIAKQTESTSTFADACVQAGTPVTQSVIGRVFSLPNDVIVSIRPNSNCSEVLLRVDDPNNSSNSSSRIADTPGTSNNTIAALAMADFNRDGYQDIFFINPRLAQVWTAKCNNDPAVACTGTPGNAVSDGVLMASQISLDHTLYASPPVTGDLNGDGAIDIAWPTFDANGSIQVRFMSVCPAGGVTIFGQTCTQAFQIMQSTTHISTGGTRNVTSQNTPRPYIALTAGNFDGRVDPTTGIASAELLVALANANHTKATLTVYRFDQGLSPHAAASLANVPDGHSLEADESNTLQLFLASGLLEWSNPRPQAVFGSTIDGGSVDHHGFLSVITFDEDLNMTAHDTVLNTGPNNDKKTRIFGLAVGRFDPPDPAAGGADFNRQVAALVDFHAESTHLQVFTLPTIPQTAFSPLTLALNWQVSADRYYDNKFAQLAALQAGDLQGRSLLLGAPTKVTVAQTQADTVLGLPPMHVDFVPPPGGGAPRVLNLSVFPGTFNTGYEFEAGSTSQSSREHTTSYSTAVEGFVSGKRVYGNPKVASVTVKMKLSLEGTHEREVSTKHDTYSTRSDSFSSETDFDDLVAASSKQMNIWSYPVIGQVVCPESSADDCPDEEKVPLTVLFSGPDSIVYTQPASAAAFEWFQPVSEPGNIFSYPGTLRLLEAGEALHNPNAESVDLLTPDDTLWESQSTQTVGVDWTAGQGTEKSSSAVNEVSGEFKVSVTSKVKVVGGSRSIGAGVDVNHSNSWSTLNTSTHELDASTGVVLHRGLGSGGASDDPNFLYAGQTYIFGLPQPENTIQTDLTVPTDVHTHGRIEVAHAANMLTTGLVQSGDWWKQVYAAAPDVALNHPQRWLQKKPTAQNSQQVMFNCPIGFTSALGTPISDPGSCTETTAQPNPMNVNDAPFYKMKGFFVLADAATTGPATTLATLGDVLTLQARVYNYSLRNMEPGTTVHARFYAQPWDGTRGQFASGNGQFGFAPAVFIGEDVLEPIPAFCGGSQGAVDSCADPNAPLNWAFARVVWDTSTLTPAPATATDWKFWVVVWMERAGELMSEIQHHGLTSIPDPAVTSLAEVPVETYSNNLGFYNQVFTLLAPTTGAVAGAAPGGKQPGVAPEAFEVADTVLRDRVTTVRVHHRVTGRAFEYVRALLFEGDPLAGGKLVDMDIIPHVTPGAPFVVPFHYQPRACGPQRLFVHAAPVDGGELVEAALDLTVTLDPRAASRQLIELAAGLALEKGTKQSLLATLQAAERSFQHGNQTAGLNQLAAFANQLRAQSGKKIPAADAATMIARVEDLAGCL